MEEAISCNVYMSSEELVKIRAQWFSKWIARSSKLKSKEEELKKSMPSYLRKSLEAILKDEGYPDPGVFDEISEGTAFTGQVPCTGVFDRNLKPAEICVGHLASGSVAMNKSIFHSVRSSGDAEVDKVVLEKTLEERDAGWLRGPLEFNELPPGAVLSRRFGVKQPNKVRLLCRP